MNPTDGALKQGGRRAGAGRKPIEIDLLELEKLCILGATDEDIAAWFRCTTRTIEKRKRTDPQFAEAMERGRAKCRISLRRWQMKVAEAGNGSMLIWLGKQMLGQRDVTPIELTGANGTPLKITMEAIDAILTEGKKSRRG